MAIGASVNRMVATHLTWAVWDKALGVQLKDHVWANPTVEDLMRSLNPAFLKRGSPSAMNAMLPWLRRPGFPVISLSLSSDGKTLKATQRPMSKYLKDADPWWVPLQVHTSKNPSGTVLFEFNTTEATMKLDTTPEVLVGDPEFWVSHRRYLSRMIVL